MPKMRWDELLKRIPLTPTIGVEVGVWRGDLSERLLKARPKLVLWMVDVWTDEAQGERLSKHCPAEDAMAIVKDISRKYGPDRAKIIRKPSVQAAGLFQMFSVDFVFIDARHNYQSVKQDIGAWFPMVRKGGFVSGHDYHPTKYPGCVQAVDEAFGDEVTLGEDWTWFVKK